MIKKTTFMIVIMLQVSSIITMDTQRPISSIITMDRQRPNRGGNERATTVVANSKGLHSRICQAKTIEELARILGIDLTPRMNRRGELMNDNLPTVSQLFQWKEGYLRYLKGIPSNQSAIGESSARRYAKLLYNRLNNPEALQDAMNEVDRAVTLSKK